MRNTRVAVRLKYSFLVLALLPAISAQQGVNPTIAAIKTEGLRSPEAPALFHRLTDVIGPRLTGSPSHLEAARWAVEQFRNWGLVNPRMEPFDFGRG
jgi:hypothetical protein